MRGIDLECCRRRQHGDGPGSCPRGGHRRQPRRAGRGRRAGEDCDVTARILMRVARGERERRFPQQRQVLVEGARADDTLRNADVGHHDLAAERPAGFEQVPGLLAHEGNGHVGLQAGAVGASGQSRQARRQIDRDHRPARAFDRIEDRSERGIERPRQAGAVERIDDNACRIGAIVAERSRFDRTVPRRQFRVAARPRRTMRPDVHRAAGLRQQPRDDVSVAAIVARAAEHVDTRRARIAAQHFGRDGRAGVQHQPIAVERPRFDRGAVDIGHLVRREDFVRHCGVEIPRPSQASLLAPVLANRQCAYDLGVLPCKCAVRTSGVRCRSGADGRQERGVHPKLRRPPRWASFLMSGIERAGSGMLRASSGPGRALSPVFPYAEAMSR